MTIIEALIQALRKNLPNPLIKDAENVKLLELYAERILSADISDTHSFGASRDVEKLREIARFINKVEYRLDELEFPTKRHLNSELGSIFPSEEDFGPLINSIKAIRGLRHAVECLRQRESYSFKPSRKPNWRAISVAKCCRRIWAEAEWRSNKEKYGQAPSNVLLTFNMNDAEKKDWLAQKDKYEKILISFPPRTQHHLRPGPFGRFLEDVFEVLGIVARNGSPVTAATALDALFKVEHQEDGGKK